MSVPILFIGGISMLIAGLLGIPSEPFQAGGFLLLVIATSISSKNKEK